MNDNTEHASIFEALAAAQAEFKAPNKTKKAAYGMYADLAEILAAVRPALNAHGIYLFQKVTSDGVNVSVETVLGYKTGEVLSSGVLTMPVVRPGYSSSSAQGIGATRTYACRYSLSTFLRKISAWLGYNSPTRGQASLIKGLRAASGES